MAKVFHATEGFATEAEGQTRVVSEGETFAEGHPVVKAHPGAFEERAADNAVPARRRTKAKAKGGKRKRSSGR